MNETLPQFRAARLPSLTVVIPTVDRPRSLAHAVAMLLDQSDPDFRLLILDQSDREHPDVDGWRRQFGARLDYRRLEKRSLPHARNMAIALAATDALCFLDDDIEPDAGLVAAHRRALARPGVAGVAGRVTGGYDQDEYGGRVIGRFSAWYPKAVRNFHKDSPADPVEHAPGGNFSLWLRWFTAAGAFDERFAGAASIGEESDFFLRLKPRLKEAGERLVFEPGAAILHLHADEGGCRERDHRAWVFWHAHNQTLLLRRYYPRRAFWPFLAWRLARALAFIVQFRRFGMVAATTAGILAGLRDFRAFGHATLNTAARC